MECILKHCDKDQRGGGYCRAHYHTHVFLIKRPLYNTWCNIKRRCRDQRHPRYADWGGRGIDICEQWYFDYFSFANGVGPRPSPFHQLDRVDNNRGYEPGNTRWATATTQARNRRTRRSSSTGEKGVEARPNGTYVARITINKRRINLGTYRSIEDAIIARQIAEQDYSF